MNDNGPGSICRRLCGMVPKMVLLAFAFIFFGCGSGQKSDNEQVQSRLSTKALQQFSTGKQLYARYCQNCHMENGEGLGKLIPPLKGADYLLNDVASAARIIKYGLDGPIEVNGVEYNQPMPASPGLTAVEITELLIYISNAWGNKAAPIVLAEVEEVLPSRQ